MTRKFIIGVIILLVLIALWFLVVRRAFEKQITILHTNDIHGAFLPSEANWVETTPPPLIGGFSALNSYIRQWRAQRANSLLLDAGDFMTGNLICNIEYSGAKGGALVHFMNQMGFEGMSLGNHEFDNSQENLKRLIQLAKFPIFCANLYTTDSSLFAPAAYHIYQKRGLRVGVIGVITSELFEVLNLDRRTGLVLKPAVPIIEKVAAEIDPRTDLIVVLSHCGFDVDSVMATQLSRRIDVIVGGHSHTRLEQPRRINDILVVQAGSNCRNLGVLDLTVAGDTVKTYQGQLIPLWADGILSEPNLAGEIEHYKQMIDEQYGMVLGSLAEDWQRSSNSESNIGNFLADCMREYTKADFSFINSGGIRKNLQKGKITRRDVMEILPFENYVYTFQVTGQELLQIMELNAQKAANDAGGLLQIAGMSYRWRKQPNGKALLVNPLIQQRKINPTANYTGATVDFVVLANSNLYFGFEPRALKSTGQLFADIAIQMISQKQTIHSTIEGRMRAIE
ncbi:bifunctional metallophosphatase/5'-nucleotidase [candidate division KSB1 bacterium]|nr:bifunctional metallophosphatase/5'-nucleotidase [candidate division KSB1 bacterium]